MGGILRLAHPLRLRPRSLSSQTALNTSAIVVVAGLLTIVALNTVLSHALRAELLTKGQALTHTVGESIANPLIDGDLLAVQDTLGNLKASSPDIVYAYAFGPEGRPIIHTFPDGFPHDLLSAHRIPAGQEENVLLLSTENGPVRDFAWRPLDGLPAEVHIGFSENHILATQQQVTAILAGLTFLGTLLGVCAAVAFGLLVARPLTVLAASARRLGEGRFEHMPAVERDDEIGDLTRAFNQMATDVQDSIDRLQASEAGYRALIAAASEVGESIALIADSGPAEGAFLFVNAEFCRLTGYREKDLLGVSAAEVLHPDSLNQVAATWQAIRSGEAVPSHEMTLVARDGRSTVVETSGTMLDYQGQRALAWFARDVTERRAGEEEIRRRNRELAAINAVAVAMSNPGDSDEGLRRALTMVLDALQLPCGWIYLTGHDGSPARLSASVGMDAGALERHLQAAFPNCGCLEVLTSGEPRILHPRKGCTIWGSAAPDGQTLCCHATVPLIGRERILGVLSVASTVPQGFEAGNFALPEAVGRHMGVALDNARLWAELEEKERLRAELLARAIHVQEDERRRIARELHDETGQALGAMVFGLKAAEAALESNSGHQAREIIARLKGAASDNVRELQGIIYDLRPSVLDDLGLIPALRWLAESRLEVSGIEVQWAITGDERRLGPEVETALFRIGQEALSNILRHAEAHQVGLGLDFSARSVSLSVWDDGQGFDTESVFAHRDETGRGLGLLGMRERVELMGGAFAVESRPGEGTMVRVHVPLMAGQVRS